MISGAEFTCPRCLARSSRDASLRFCPRCGLAIEVDHAAPLELAAAGQSIIVQDRLAFGDVANLYRCTFPKLKQIGVFKIARSASDNHHLIHEADVLSRLHAADVAGGFLPFLPRLLESISYVSDGEPAQCANVLAYHEGISTPDELYTLAEVRNAYPNGIDARDMAWIWRRLLTILAFVHQQRIVHASISPDHVLIEPKEHKLVLIGWCSAVHPGQARTIKSLRWQDFNEKTKSISPASDLAAASRTMSFLLRKGVDPAIARHLERACETSASADRFLANFDRMIEALWGPRRFRTFAMPHRGR